MERIIGLVFAGPFMDKSEVELGNCLTGEYVGDGGFGSDPKSSDSGVLPGISLGPIKLLRMGISVFLVGLLGPLLILIF